MDATYVDHMGSDLSVVKAAKVSMAADESVQELITEALAYQKGIRSHNALIKYLARHRHWTPFAHTAITLRVTAPVPIRTQCFKHKQGFVENEESRRYISGTPQLFVPRFFREKADKIKQGSAGKHPYNEPWKNAYEQMCYDAIDTYTAMIEDGVCPEQARLVLPQGVEVNWYWTGNLASFARFVAQRTDSHAQKEIRDLAKIISEIIRPLFPYSWEALTTPEIIK